MACDVTPGASQTAAPIDPLKHQGLVHWVAQKFRGRGLSLDDLVAEGQFGLLKACQKFDPARDITFGYYAERWIRQSIGRAIENQVPLVSVPNNLQWQVKRKAAPKSASNAKRLKAAKRAMGRHISEGTLEGNNDGIKLGGLVTDHRPSQLDQRIAAIDLADLMRCLKPKMAEVMRMRHGLDGRPPMSQSEVAKAAGKTYQAIQYTETRAMDCLREAAGVKLQRKAS